MEPANSGDLLALRSGSGFAPEMQQAIQLLSRGGTGRSPGVAECLMRIKEIDAQSQVEQCKLSETGMTERQRIVEEERSKRFDCLAEVIQASVKEGAVTTRQAISARAEVSKQTIKGSVQIEESRLKAQTSSNLWQWAVLTFAFSATMGLRLRQASHRSSLTRRLFHLLPWLILASLAWRKFRKMQLTVQQLLNMRWESFLSLENLRGAWSLWSQPTELANGSVESKCHEESRTDQQDEAENSSAVEDTRSEDMASPASKAADEELQNTEGCSLQQFLQQAGLEAYADCLVANGYDTEVLFDLDSADQEEMLQTISCLPGHKVKFRKLLKNRSGSSNAKDA